MLINIAIIKDQSNLKLWETKAINYVLEKNKEAKVKLILEKNSKKKAKINYFKNFVYIFIRLFIMRPHAWSNSKYPNNYNSRKISFKPNKSLKPKNWEELPGDVIDEIKKEKIDIIFKFGMGLLNTKKIKIRYGVLSYHHGDPSKYRGRPAGFYEFLNNEDYVGAMVQKINNTIDKGQVLSFRKFKIYKYSFKKTLNNLYMQSAFLLNDSFKNITGKKSYRLKFNSDGKLYKLPNNLLSLIFLKEIFLNLFQRIIKILFFVKKWNVGQIKIKKYFFSNFNIFKEDKLPINKEYEFIADPFFLDGNDQYILCEGLNKKTCKGDILLYKDKKFNKKIFFPEHISFPFNTNIYNKNDDIIFLFETIQFENLYIYKFDKKNKKFNKFNKFQSILDFKCIDPVYFQHQSLHYLFVTPAKQNKILKLFFSKHLNHSYTEHPCSPISYDARGSRMAGKIYKLNNKLFRLGQIDSQIYGDGISVFEILNLDNNNYNEKFIKEIKFKKHFGPHTLNINNDKVVYDYYEEKFDLFAIFKKFKNIL